MDAYLTGLEAARDAGLDSPGSARWSFFVSSGRHRGRQAPRRHRQPGRGRTKGKAAVANARLAYAAYQEVVASDRWRLLAEAGAHVQRPPGRPPA